MQHFLSSIKERGKVFFVQSTLQKIILNIRKSYEALFVIYEDKRLT